MNRGALAASLMGTAQFYVTADRRGKIPSAGYGLCVSQLRLPADLQACLFDLDGVLTDTASVHSKAWKQTFDAFLAAHAQGEEARPFAPQDYTRYVDGKTREDGVRAFLASRGIEPDPETVQQVSLAKNERLLAAIEDDGVRLFDGSVRLVRAAREAGMRTAVVSSSANTRAVLKATDTADLFDAVVDGTTIADEHLPGKPAPDAFLRGAREVGVAPGDAAVFEDALAGVEAGRAGRFALVVGVDRGGDRADALREHGADVVVSDLAELIA